jgi:hypothetical protein
MPMLAPNCYILSTVFGIEPLREPTARCIRRWTIPRMNFRTDVDWFRLSTRVLFEAVQPPIVVAEERACTLHVASFHDLQFEEICFHRVDFSTVQLGNQGMELSAV